MFTCSKLEKETNTYSGMDGRGPRELSITLEKLLTVNSFDWKKLTFVIVLLNIWFLVVSPCSSRWPTSLIILLEENKFNEPSRKRRRRGGA